MSKLPILSGDRLSKILRLLNYELDHQTGSHMILRQNHYPFRRLTIPKHREISPGTLRAIVRQAGLSVDEFKELLSR
ncbi:MAG TPA: addiction module toxin, HicA family [Desulfobacteraceae bacterium]|nr:addiction module toxin, HicA family [Desulfobacteraceae bacterium]